MKNNLSAALEKLSLLDKIPFPYSLVAPDLSKPGVEIKCPEGENDILELAKPWLTRELLKSVGFVIFRGYEPKTEVEENEEDGNEYAKTQSGYFHRDNYGWVGEVISLRYNGKACRMMQTVIGDKNRIVDQMVDLMMQNEKLAERIVPQGQSLLLNVRDRMSKLGIHLLDSFKKKQIRKAILGGGLRMDADAAAYFHNELKDTVHIKYEPNTLVIIDNQDTMHARFVPHDELSPGNIVPLKKRVLRFNEEGNLTV